MAIEKAKKTRKASKQKTTDSLAIAPDLEDKRREFQAVLRGKQPLEKTVPKKRSAISARTLAFIGVLLTVVIGGAGMLWAYTWYQSPEKVVVDAVSHALASKSTTYKGDIYLLDSLQPQISYKGGLGNDVSKLDVSVSMPLGGALSAINASVINNKDSLYVKVDKASQLIDETAPPLIKQSFQPYLPLIRDKVDGKWMKASPNDINLYEPITHVSQCAADIFQTLTTDRASVSTLRDMYIQNPFFTVKELTQANDATGRYSLTIDVKRYNAFKERLYGSEFYASLAACNKKTHDVAARDIQDLAIELTITKADRQLTNISFAQDKAFLSKFDLRPSFDTPVDIEVPQDVARVSDIQAQAFQDTVKNMFKNLQ